VRRVVIQVPYAVLDGRRQAVEVKVGEGGRQVVRPWPSGGEWVEVDEVEFGPPPPRRR